MTQSFFPPHRVLMGPGPSDVSPRVLGALGRPTIGHLDPLFVNLMDDVKGLLQYAFQTDNALTLPISAPGSAGMEACFVNLVSPGDSVIVCRNGVFGGRMQENVERCGATAIMVEDDWGQPVSLDKVAAAFSAHPEASLLAFVHAETSTGARSDVAALCALARKHGALSIVDSVTGLGGIELQVDAWGADAVYSGTQKCLSCIPGLSPVTFSPRAVERIQNRSHKVQSWFLDMQLVMGYWGGSSKRAYHHTAPINLLYALHEALLMLREEGLEAAHARHRLHHQALVAGLGALGLEMAVAAEHRLPQLNAVRIPEGIDDTRLRQTLLQDFNLEIGAGLGALAGKTWRIGLMGQACSRSNVILCLTALSTALQQQGLATDTGAALVAADAVLQA
ncbi:alanine--glyoxylate aminotransferase family protein [Haliea sp.]|jgi:alanine-glyoxylate transaminase/serine-glyoxylate transaminase/serine-pyruvate transaminase|uniref:pyridoxal-phosphate-dependent aminotransferase family protein n=1 Tax=Haliea TaxID=475794 RepID=UPI000C5843BF|nr:alanine--glyoxylate aminotransferase family protein [Haliea sp.]HBX73835.1 alanine--glyoxylate aminotransferase [Halieaceae bacterium]MAD64490.1 alanine--glyoxylate aminotransferase [Haliea sp.]MAY91768.1 alanine--glyoxylate aminotransferase [Haliea sp.]MBP70494.1 alanine--glyoxylate aminotransferase [Haliea sp.]HCD56272.1 alanine--glyoxylate aminotransferase [Halieaceae bacterium]